MVKLFCAIVGVVGSTISVRVDEDDSVDDLKDAIKAKNSTRRREEPAALPDGDGDQRVAAGRRYSGRGASEQRCFFLCEDVRVVKAIQTKPLWAERVAQRGRGSRAGGGFRVVGCRFPIAPTAESTLAAYVVGFAFVDVSTKS